MPSRIPDATRQAILKDIEAGEKSRAQIARDHDVSPQTVKNIADENGIEQPFSREQTKNATDAAVADAAARRAKVSAMFLDKAIELLERMDKPTVVYKIGGGANVYTEHPVDKPPPEDLRNLMITAATAFDKHLAADKHDNAGDNLAAVDAWLRGVIGQ